MHFKDLLTPNTNGSRDHFATCKPPVNEMLAFCTALSKLSFNDADLQSFFKHFWRTGEILSYATADNERLMQAFNIAYAPLKRELHKYFQTHFLESHGGIDTLNDSSTIYIDGKTVESITRIKELIQALGFHYTNRLNDKTTHIIIGKNPSNKEAFNREAYRYITEADLFHLDAKRAPKFLVQQAEQGNHEIVDNVSAFLFSVESTSVKIGLQMLASGGLPLEMLDTILMLAKSAEDAAVRADAKKILQTAAPVSWKLLIDDKQLFKNLNSDDAKEQDTYHKLVSIRETAGPDAAATLSMALYRRYRKGLRYMAVHNNLTPGAKEKFYNLIINKGHLDFASALGFKNWKGYTPETMTLNTYKIKYKLPTDILKHYTVTSINLHNCKLAALPKEIVEFKQVKTLDLSCNQINSIPPYIGQLSELEELDLSSSTLKEFPIQLTRLKNLRKLDLRHRRQSHQVVPLTVPDEFRQALPHCEVLV